MKHLWLVFLDTYDEGRSCEGVFSTLAKARAKMRDLAEYIEEPPELQEASKDAVKGPLDRYTYTVGTVAEIELRRVRLDP